jgi:DNA polymerase I-like protein with 3'-5' exonuclease and polymerase domains
VQKLTLVDIGENLKGRAQLVSCVHDEVIVECAEDDAELVMAEVQNFMSARSAEIFNGQPISVEAYVADSWAGDVKLPTRSTELVAAMKLSGVNPRP